MEALLRLGEGVVGSEEIDSLGHMNVAFYGEKAVAATEVILARLGFGREELGRNDLEVSVFDSYSRFHREQLEGARWTVAGGIAGVGADHLMLYHELRNAEKGELSATFVQRAGIVDRATRRLQPLPERVLAQAAGGRTDIPPYGGPRSLDLDPPRADLTPDLMEQAGLSPGLHATVAPEQCDDYGFLTRRGVHGLPIVDSERFMMATGVPVVALPEGGRLGWPTMESRHLWLANPRAGDHLRSFSGVLEVGKRHHHWRHWTFDAVRGRLVYIHDMLLLALDLETRVSMDVPADIQARLRAHLHPELK